MIYETREIEADGHKAVLSLYLWEGSKEYRVNDHRPLVLICPGGAYHNCSDREAEPVALQYLAKGYHAAVLRYSVRPVRYPVALIQVAKSVKLIRDHAAEWLLDPDRIVVQGFSAGGHLAASFGVFWNRPFLARAVGAPCETFRPNGLILCYPVITGGKFAHEGSFEALLGDRLEELREEMSLEKQVSADTPKTFIWHTFSDGSVPVENSLLFVSALRAHGIETEFHMYPKGGHGLSLARDISDGGFDSTDLPNIGTWIDMALEWVARL